MCVVKFFLMVLLSLDGPDRLIWFLVFSRVFVLQASSPVVCREFLFVVEVQRYSRDQGSSVYFPQAVLNGETGQCWTNKMDGSNRAGQN